MLTVSTRELKQNPAEAIRRVMDAGEPAAITVYGRPTGVVIAPEMQASRRTWVSGQALARAVTPMDGAQAQAWATDLADSRSGEFGRDLWGGKP
ncbi:MAG: type II toxin-antitoxin system Phd/YefM family antitoxin [Micrococcales bacterium]|nr:type II toxin-antitoxin system Phd/YefM family antitoxin [Micrococcales bacterium]